MELRIGFGRSETTLCKNTRFIQVDRLVENTAGGIYIDDFEILADGSRLQILLPGYGDRHLANSCRVHSGCYAGVKSEDPQIPDDRIRDQITPCRGDWG
jgi:hypothetical protein